jgi:hypothetical protein
MITVTILINGQPILTRSGTRTAEGLGTDKDYAEYTLDTGEKIWHAPEEGAIELAKKMLDTIDKEFAILKTKEKEE